MILDVGTKVLVVHRRLFEQDRARYFVGSVDTCESQVAQVTGHTWVQDHFNGRYLRKADARTKIISLTSPGLIVYVLPPTVQLVDLSLDTGEKGKLRLHDSKLKFEMDLSEIVHA